MADRTTEYFSLLKGNPPAGWNNLTPLPVLYGCTGKNCSYTVKLSVQSTGKTSSVAQAVIRNTGKVPLRISRIRWGISQFDGDSPSLCFPAESEPFYFSTENYRGDFLVVGSAVGNRFIKPYPNETVEIGWSEDRPFPGLFIGSSLKSLGLFCASASQEKFHTIFRLRGGNSPDTRGFEIEEYPAGTEYVSIAPGESLAGEKLFFSVLDTSDTQRASAGYYRYLRSRGVFDRVKKHNPLARQRIWCSWNYDFFDKITEEACFRQIPVLKKHLSMVKFLQLDDGYQSVIKPAGHPPQRMQIDFLYKNDTPFNKIKFPGGPAAYVEKCRQAGLRPAIWLGLWATTRGRMLTEHPDWILRSDSGKPLSMHSSHYGGVSMLDPSVPGVRRYLDYVCRTIFKEWGFEGIKLDFSSAAFESKRIRFRHPGKTALEWRKWLVDTFRTYLPENGFFGWCVTAGTGNPLLAPEADYFRNAEDIGKGCWEKVKRIACWCVNTNILMPERPVFPNIDSIGLSKRLSEREWKSWLNLCAITGYALEVSGDLTMLNEKQLKHLGRTLEISSPTRKFKCVDVPYGQIENPPSLWLAKEKKGLLVAIFNWGETACRISSRHYPIRDLLYGRTSAVSAFDGKVLNLASATVPPHGSLLLYAEERKK